VLPDRVIHHDMLRAATQNRLLASLSEDDFKRWAPHLAAVRMPQGQVLSVAGQPATDVYFPTTAIVSLLFGARGAPATEVGMVGSEGVVGFGPFLEDGAGALGSAVVQSAGWGFRLPLQTLRRDLGQNAVLQLLLRHAYALIMQMAQTVACVRHHSVHEQVCRWLLLCLDRVDGHELGTTHALIAARLGVRRSSVSECAHRLRDEGYIRYTRGRLSVVDRAGLEQRACGCYGLISEEYRRLQLARPAGTAVLP
jgi:CRP-like cAMP-binding protein